MVGTFYRARRPVRRRSSRREARWSRTQIVCIIEVMKL